MAEHRRIKTLMHAGGRGVNNMGLIGDLRIIRSAIKFVELDGRLPQVQRRMTSLEGTKRQYYIYCIGRSTDVELSARQIQLFSPVAVVSSEGIQQAHDECLRYRAHVSHWGSRDKICIR